MDINFTLSPQAVAIGTANGKPAILVAIAAQFARAYGLDLAMVLEALEEREKLGSTGFGRGVALPHARIEGIHRPVAAVLKLSAPVGFEAADDMPVELVFGLLSPVNAGATHLHALAEISRLMRDDALRESLFEANNAEAIFALLTNVSDRDAA
ncbi:PTS sugar transporter subunit IIA [Altererythrobacter sp. H2]|uniref:PTS sugar transporter subunit IIA n=1 Tax=Altererythrobacter sp. H2 TaxID=3108391 RepID=UPI000BC8DC41|nr:PTS sugar transporter subunit IIA [Altererythrobacter sp. H2]OZA94013.1 MAG: transcriptional regulator [Erythrobacter sp. 34-65-8]WRK96061.1 PTS sugar transporter subunit IIA [Altererythrobacter sp. H2]